MQNGVPKPALAAIGETPYQRWIGALGVPVYTGSYVEDLHTAAVAPWPRFGQPGAIVTLAEQEKNDAWLLEIEPGGQTNEVHHLCEASYYVVQGRGATTIWQAGGARQTVEWQTGSLFSPPLNTHYQHFNLDGQQPARLFAATSLPLLINIFKNGEFVFDCPSVFPERYNGADDYFASPGQRLGYRRWQTNFVADARAFPLDLDNRGSGSTNMGFDMANNALSMHMSEFPTGTYKKAHKHTAGAEIVILSGTGYSLLWYADGERIKVDWHEGTVFSPRDGEYHQHFNTGTVPARYLAIYNRMVVHNTREMRGADVSETEGGWQIEYEDEDPTIYQLFEAECARHGSKVTLPKLSHR